jgi:predicted nucleic acid-binding protein
MLYYDTGVLLKLYTEERESSAIRDFVTQRNERIPFHSLHHGECTSALELKAFRGECTREQSASALADVEDDLANRVLLPVAIDWVVAWRMCREMARAFAAETGCRTLDTLHIACARFLSIRDIVTTDSRQLHLAERVGMRPVHPLRLP